jgi:hypothetical protein
MPNIARMPTPWLESVGNVSLFDDFISEPLANLLYVTSTTDGGTATVGDTVGGVLTLLSSAASDTDNDENWLATINEVFLCGAGRALETKALIQYTEAATNAANVFFGFASAVGANLLVDDGGGPRTSGNIIGIYKVDGGTVWRCVTRWGSTTSVTDTVSTTTAGGSAYQTLEVSIADGGSVGTSLVTFRVDGQELKDSTGATIVHSFPNASATEMQLGLYVKQGTAAAQSVLIDKWFASQSY